MLAGVGTTGYGPAVFQSWILLISIHKALISLKSIFKFSKNLSPKIKDSVASFPPNLILVPTLTMKFDLVSKLKPFWAPKLIVFCELNNIWSKLELNNNLPDDIITWFPI